MAFGHLAPRTLELAAVVLLAALAAALALGVPAVPGYDAYFHLVWGRELASGASPSYEAFAAPTPHPLYVALAAVLSVAGDGADRLLVLASSLSLVALLWGAYRLGAATLGRLPGLLGAVLLGSSTVLALLAARAFVDVPFLAVLVWAAVVEAEARGRDRSLAVLALLAVAGLLRPEAWLFAAAYLVWKAYRTPLTAGALALRTGLIAVAPLLWAAGDWAATGSPVHSLTGTRELAEQIERTTGIAAVPREAAVALHELFRAPVVLAGLAGLALAWRRLGLERIALPAALVAGALAAFAATGLAGLALQPRYLAPAAVGVALFAGYLVLGFTTLEPGDRARRPWGRAAAVAGVLAIALAGTQLGAVGRAAEELRFGRDVDRDLEELLADGRVREGMRCGPLSFPTHRLVPESRWILDAGEGRVVSRAEGEVGSGVAVYVTGDRSRRRLGEADGVDPGTNRPDPRFRPLGRIGRFEVHVRCP